MITNTHCFLFGGRVSTAYHSWKASTEMDTAIWDENTGTQPKLERYLGIKCCIANHMPAFSFLKPWYKLKLFFSVLWYISQKHIHSYYLTTKPINSRRFLYPFLKHNLQSYIADKGVLLTRLKSRSHIVHTLLPMKQGSVSQPPHIFLEGAALATS